MPAPLSILIVNWRDVRHPRAGGAEAYLANLAACWIAAGCRVSWLTSRPRGLARREVVDGVEVHRIGGRASMYALVPWYYLRHLRGRFDVIVDSENGIPQFTPLFSSTPKVALTYHVHREVFLNHLPLPLAWLLIWLELRAVPFLYRDVPFVTISETTRAQMVRYRKSRRPITLIEPGIAAGLIPAAKSEEPSLLYLGRLQPYKRVDRLIRLAARLRSRFPTLLLDVVGVGDERGRLEELARRLDVVDAVRFHGFVDEDAKRRFLQRAWVSVTASEMEGWGIGVIEAAACETPSVAYDVPGLRDAIVDGETGLLAADDEAFAGQVARLLTEPDLRARLGTGALRRAQQYGWPERAEQFLTLLRSLVSEPRAAVPPAGERARA